MNMASRNPAIFPDVICRDRRLGAGSRILPPLRQGLVISDLHLFSPCSNAEEQLRRIKRHLERIDTLVLNGDTFDFRWSMYPSEKASVHAALLWMERLAVQFDGRRVHYVLGNHDCLKSFQCRLEEFARGSRVVKLHGMSLCLGRSLFLHGDCAIPQMTGEKLATYREAWSRDRPCGPVGSGLYAIAASTGVGRLLHHYYFPRQATVGRVSRYLDEVLPAWRQKTVDCFFGHTHMPFRNHVEGGVRFHNTGSAIRGMGFQPLFFEY
jgi:predicted phosphodiesterase